MASYQKLLARARRQRSEDALINLIDHFGEVLGYMVLSGQPPGGISNTMYTLLPWLESQLDALKDDEHATRVLVFQQVRLLLGTPGDDSPFIVDSDPALILNTLDHIDVTALTKLLDARQRWTGAEFEACLLLDLYEFSPEAAGKIMNRPAGKVRQLVNDAYAKFERDQ